MEGRDVKIPPVFFRTLSPSVPSGAAAQKGKKIKKTDRYGADRYEAMRTLEMQFKTSKILKNASPVLPVSNERFQWCAFPQWAKSVEIDA